MHVITTDQSAPPYAQISKYGSKWYTQEQPQQDPSRRVMRTEPEFSAKINIPKYQRVDYNKANPRQSKRKSNVSPSAFLHMRLF
jgi:hypothetical protein